MSEESSPQVASLARDALMQKGWRDAVIAIQQLPNQWLEQYLESSGIRVGPFQELINESPELLVNYFVTYDAVAAGEGREFNTKLKAAGAALEERLAISKSKSLVLGRGLVCLGYYCHGDLHEQYKAELGDIFNPQASALMMPDVTALQAWLQRSRKSRRRKHSPERIIPSMQSGQVTILISVSAKSVLTGARLEATIKLARKLYPNSLLRIVLSDTLQRHNEFNQDAVVVDDILQGDFSEEDKRLHSIEKGKIWLAANQEILAKYQVEILDWDSFLDCEDAGFIAFRDYFEHEVSGQLAQGSGALQEAILSTATTISTARTQRNYTATGGESHTVASQGVPLKVLIQSSINYLVEELPIFMYLMLKDNGTILYPGAMSDAIRASHEHTCQAFSNMRLGIWQPVQFKDITSLEAHAEVPEHFSAFSVMSRGEIQVSRTYLQDRVNSLSKCISDKQTQLMQAQSYSAKVYVWGMDQIQQIFLVAENAFGPKMRLFMLFLFSDRVSELWTEEMRLIKEASQQLNDAAVAILHLGVQIAGSEFVTKAESLSEEVGRFGNMMKNFHCSSDLERSVTDLVDLAQTQIKAFPKRICLDTDFAQQLRRLSHWEDGSARASMQRRGSLSRSASDAAEDWMLAHLVIPQRR